MRRLCTICARGGSKGVKSKNIQIVAGIPLIAHSIKQAQQSNIFDAIAVSSDSEEILAVARDFGATLTIKRPSELATDTAAKLPVIQHAALTAESMLNKTFEVFCDLDATSPLRSIEDIKGAINLLETKGLGNVITGTPSRRSPYFNLVEQTADGCVALSKVPLHGVVRRQDAPRTFDMNASIYVWTRRSLLDSDRVLHKNTYLFEMPEERSIDIDSELDLRIVKFLMENPH